MLVSDIQVFNYITHAKKGLLQSNWQKIQWDIKRHKEDLHRRSVIGCGIGAAVGVISVAAEVLLLREHASLPVIAVWAVATMLFFATVGLNIATFQVVQEYTTWNEEVIGSIKEEERAYVNSVSCFDCLTRQKSKEIYVRNGMLYVEMSADSGPTGFLGDTREFPCTVTTHMATEDPFVACYDNEIVVGLYSEG